MTTIDPPDVPIAPPVPAGNSPDEVRARFNKIVQESAPEERGGIQVPDVTKTPEPQKEAVKTPEPSKGTEIPPEIFGESKPTGEGDEYEQLIKEEIKGHTTNENFKKFRSATDKYVGKLKAQLAELEGKIPKGDFVPEKVSKQLEALQKELQEKSDLIGRKYVEESPEFRSQFPAEKERITKQLLKFAEDVEVKADVIQQLLHSSPKRQIEILDNLELSASAVYRINTLLEQHGQVDAKQAEFLENWQAKQAEIEQQRAMESDKEKAHIKGLYDKAFDDVLSELREKNGMFQKRGNEAWDKETESLIEEARQYYNAENSTPHKDAEMFLAGAMARRGWAMFERVNQLYAEQKKLNEELVAAGPNGGHGLDGKLPDPTANMTPDERARYSFNQAMATARNSA